jgi:hypothetical protein
MKQPENMNTDINNEADRLLRRAVRKVTPESPGDQFVSSVMQRIQLIPQKQTVKNEPLISKKGWIFIFLIIVLMFSMVMMTKSNDISFTTLRNYYNDFITSYFSIFLSRFFVAGMVVLAVMFIFQMFLLNQRINRLQNAGQEN